MILIKPLPPISDHCTTLAWWLGWIQCFLRDVNSDSDHSVIESKMRWGIVILNKQDGENFPMYEAICVRESEDERLFHQCSVCVSF